MKSKWLIDDMLNLFYPRKCQLCEMPLIDVEKYMCLSCLNRLPKTDYCMQKSNPAKSLFAGYPQVKTVSAFLFFEKGGMTQRLIHSFKYHDRSDLAEYLGRMAAIEHKEHGFYASIDSVVPVPLHTRKEASRGYNQSTFIAKGFAEIYGCKVEQQCLKRSIETATQTNKSTYDRHVNVENIFYITDVASLYGKHILLVDDVMTTGATLSACINVLMTVPEISISVFSLAIARAF